MQKLPPTSGTSDILLDTGLYIVEVYLHGFVF